MPHFYFRRKSDGREEKYFAEMPRSQPQDVVVPTTQGKSSSSSYLSNYEKLPHYLKCCLDYVAVVADSWRYFGPRKDELVRLLVAEGLIPEKTGQTMEDVAENTIEELIGLGMVQEIQSCCLQVVDRYKKLCLIEVDEQNFVSKAAESPVRAAFIVDRMKDPLEFRNFKIRSLFLRVNSTWYSDKVLSLATMQAICKLQFLRVLYICGAIEALPDEVGDLVHLTSLELIYSQLDKLPKSLGNLQKLQTLDIRCSAKLHKLPIEVLKIQQLRHLLVRDSINYYEIRVPKGIGKLVNLQTCEGVYAGDGIANELGTLTQLRRFGVRRVSQDHASELAEAIMKMENLVSLSLQAEITLLGHGFTGFLPEFESFSPPCLLQEIRLCGGLVEMPNWLLSMRSITRLSLYESNLTENSISVLQYLPNLEHLDLWEACNAKIISKEFCKVGGFPQLKCLHIDSMFLAEWNEIVSGAFPSLRCLQFSYCSNLRSLPEGLQNVSTLQELGLRKFHTDLARRLQGEENYKIKHISNVWFE